MPCERLLKANMIPAKKNYRPDIDGLRALAVLSVVAFHAYPSSFKGGFVGVDIFFVISGFLICGIILNGLGDGSFSLGKFYQRRIFRLFPSLTIVLLSTLAFGWFSLLPDEYLALGKHSAGGAGFISNLVLWHEIDYWDVSAKLKPLLHLWSLGIEEQFYIIFPCLLLVAWKSGFRVVTFVATLLFISFVCNIHYYKSDPGLAFYAPYTRFWELLVGAALAAASANKSHRLNEIKLRVDSLFARFLFARKVINDGRTLGNILSFSGCLLLFCALRFARVDKDFPGVYALLPTLGAALIIAAGPHAWLNRIFFSNKIAVGLGLISYPLYLWHWPILSYFHILGWDASGAWTWRLLRLGCIICAILLAFLTYRYVESPIRFGKKKRTLKTVCLVFIMCCTGFFGLHIYLNKGLPDRSSISSYEKNLFGAQSGRGASFAPEEIEAAKKYAQNIKYETRYRDVGSATTVAVIGDSHAASAFFGIAEKNAELGLNTLGIPYDFRHSDETRQAALDILKEENIRAVFVFYRGVLYLTGNDVDGFKNYKAAPLNEFEPFLQKTVNTLTSLNKHVYLVSENPVLPYKPRMYIARPLGYGSAGKQLPPSKQKVLEHQKNYLSLLDKLHGATIIKSIDAFCPQERCLDFLNDGQVLYYDDDHLSVSGSLFQAEELLAPYLEQIASQAADK